MRIHYYRRGYYWQRFFSQLKSRCRFFSTDVTTNSYTLSSILVFYKFFFCSKSKSFIVSLTSLSCILHIIHHRTGSKASRSSPFHDNRCNEFGVKFEYSMLTPHIVRIVTTKAFRQKSSRRILVNSVKWGDWNIPQK